MNFLLDCDIEVEVRRLDGYLDAYRERFIEKIIPLPEKSDKFLGQNSMFYIQLALCRSKLAVDGVISALKEQNILLVMLAVRAHFEVTGALAYYHKKVDNYYHDTIPYEVLNQSLHRLVMGVKSEEREVHTPDPVNVMTMIDAADDFFREAEQESSVSFRKKYGFMSEFCHPNFYGITMQSDINEQGVVHYKFGSHMEKKDLVVIRYLIESISAFLNLYDRIYTLLDKHQDLPDHYKS